jgi:hypothetical protein
VDRAGGEDEVAAAMPAQRRWRVMTEIPRSREKDLGRWAWTPADKRRRRPKHFWSGLTSEEFGISPVQVFFCSDELFRVSKV